MKKTFVAKLLALVLAGSMIASIPVSAEEMDAVQELNLVFTDLKTLDVNDVRNANEFQVLTEIQEGLFRVFTDYVNAVSGRDVTIVLGQTVIIAALYIIVIFFTDILYTLVDPRIRIRGGKK